MAYMPNLQSPQQYGPQYNPYQPPPNAGRSGDPAQFPGYNPFNSRDVYNQYQGVGQSNFQTQQDYQNYLRAQAQQQQNTAGGYEQAGQDIYNPILQGQGGGYTDQQMQNVLQSQGMQDISDQLPGNFLNQGEQTAIAGDPNAGYNEYAGNVNSLNANAAAHGQNVQNQAAAGQAHNAAILGYGQSAVDKAAGDPGLSVTGQYLNQAGMSDQEVQDMQEAAARGVGAQFGATKDQLLQNAAASGTATPMGIAASMGALDRSSAASQADALLNARLQARAAQRQAATGVQNTQLQAGQYRAGLGTQAGLGIMNAGIGANENLTAQSVGAGEYAGNLNMNQQNQNVQNLTNLKSQAEQNASARAAQLATNRQGTAQYNQGAQMGLNQAASQRYVTGYAPQLQAQQEARNWVTGQQQLHQGQANTAMGQAQQASQQQTQGGLAAAGGTAAWGSSGGQGFGDYAARAASNLFNPASYTGSYTGSKGTIGLAARGGLLTHEQLIHVGEGDRPEVILPLDPSTAPMRRNPWEKMGAHLGRAMGLKQGVNDYRSNMGRHHAGAFGLPYSEMGSIAHA
jgi:hypothetical protein